MTTEGCLEFFRFSGMRCSFSGVAHGLVLTIPGLLLGLPAHGSRGVKIPGIGRPRKGFMTVSVLDSVPYTCSGSSLHFFPGWRCQSAKRRSTLECNRNTNGSLKEVCGFPMVP